MKHFGIVASLNFLAFVATGQHNSGKLVASVTNNERLSIVKNSIIVPTWHEKTFWPLYEDYLNNTTEVASLSYRSLDNMARLNGNLSGEETFSYVRSMIKNRFDLLALKERYYAQIGAGFNGIIALQFLQTEALLDMMECSRIYEETEWKKFRFHPKAQDQESFKTAKHNTIKTALGITNDKAEAFWKVYNRFEEECDAILGQDYSLISLYAGDPTDFTPGLAKRLGADFLQVMKREAKLKEKYFLQMNEAVGPILASRFLAWEDYYSLVSKMYAWAEN